VKGPGRSIRLMSPTPAARIQRAIELDDHPLYKKNRSLRHCNRIHFSKEQMPNGFEELAIRMIHHLRENGHLQEHEPLHILDLGCGQGVFLKELKERLEDAGHSVQVFGITLKPDVAYAQKHELGIRQGLIEELPAEWDEKMHLVVGTAIMPTVRVNEMIGQVRRVLHPDGLATIHLDHPGSPEATEEFNKRAHQDPAHFMVRPNSRSKNGAASICKNPHIFKKVGLHAD